MHSLPEANYLNPAVQIDCGVFVGLPLVSSFHMNLANSGFTANKFLVVYTNGSVSRKQNMKTSGMPDKNYFLTEFHSVLAAVGVRHNDYYFNFTITEKNNGEFIYTPDFIAFTLRGSPEFEGQTLKLQGIRFTLDHVREYALGMSRVYNNRLTFGIKMKVLFGKFNFTTGNSTFGARVEQGTRNILFDIHGGFNSSLPYGLYQTGPDMYDYREIYQASLFKNLMNIKNPGFAVDLGFIYKYSDEWTFSGSALDVGLVWYRSNLNNYNINGTYLYSGPFGADYITDQYLWHLFNEWNRNMNESVTARPYTQLLRPRIYLGASRKLNKRYDLNLLLYNHFLPSKIQTGVTVSLLTRADKKLRTSVSWSYMNNSPVNLGLGVSYGHKPLQLYFVTDNILGFIIPTGTKNINLRMGLNLRFGCNSTFNLNDCGCSWMKGEKERRLRKEKLRKSSKTVNGKR
jgi:hypothetical protein